MSAAKDFGVQSYCFRNFKDNAEVAKMVREIDLNKIEVCAVHADFNDTTAWKNVVDTYKNEGVDIVSIGVQTFNGADKEKEWFECAAMAGAKHISAHFKVNTFTTAIPKVQKWCDEYGIRIGIHCHGGYMFGGSPDVLRHLFDLGGPQIGLNIDTAWCMQIGPNQGKPVKWTEDFAGKIYGVHYKDFTFESNGQWQDTIVGQGNLDLPAFIQGLEKGGFDGMAVIEYEADVEAPVASLKKCVEAMRSAF